MLKLTNLLTVVFLFFFLKPAFGQTKYIKKYKPTADSLCRVYGVPAALILSVAIVESGSGTSRNAKLLNNHFGMSGKNTMLKRKGIKSRYKQYRNARQSFTNFVTHLTNRKFYSRLKGNMNCVLWVNAIGRDGYSEKPKIWKQRVLSTIKKYKLTSPQ